MGKEDAIEKPRTPCMSQTALYAILLKEEQRNLNLTGMVLTSEKLVYI
jgi:hypothetical protein